MKTVQPIRDVTMMEKFYDLLKEESDRNALMFHFGIYSGLRIGDIINLKVSDVKGDYVSIVETKTKKPKRFAINDKLKSEIAEYITGMNDNDWLFPSRKGDSHITRTAAWRVLNKVANQLGLEEIGCHSLRKTFGFHAYKQTKDIAMLQNIFNHSSPAITLCYIGITQHDMDEFMATFTF